MFGDLFGEDNDGGMSVALSASAAEAEERARMLEKPPEERSSSRLAGLDNQGATCYLNSLLQTLYFSPEFRGGLYSVDPASLGVDLAAEAAVRRRPPRRPQPRQRSHRGQRGRRPCSRG